MSAGDYRTTAEQDRIIIDLYINGGLPAKVVAEIAGPPLSQSAIYFKARRLQKKLGLPHYDRRPEQRVDWNLAQEFKDGGASSGEIAEFFGTTEQYIEYGRHNAQKPRRGRVKPRGLRRSLGA